MRVIRLPSIGSTNDEARRRFADGEPLPFALVAETQTGGRGRLGRPWTSPPGGVWLTVAWHHSLLAAPPTLAIAIAEATARVVDRTLGVPGDAEPVCRIKWPNDLLLLDADGAARKVGGILIEATPPRTCGTAAGALFIGLGINADFDVAELPHDLQTVATTLRTYANRPVDSVVLALTLVGALSQALDEHAEQGLTPECLARVRERLAYLNQAVELKPSEFDSSPVITGDLTGLDELGRLTILDEAGVTHIVTSNATLRPRQTN